MSNSDRDDILREAFAFQPRLVAYAYSMLQNHNTAEDIVQEAYLVIVKKYDQFTPGTSLFAWSRTIVRLQVLSYIKKNRREVSLEDQVLTDAVDAAFEEFQESLSPVRHEYLRECITKLPEKGKKSIKLRYHDKLSYEDISTFLGMKLEAVRKTLFRVKKKLKTCIEMRSNLENLM